MANISDIEGFLLTGMNPNWATWVGTTVDTHSQFGYFDFIDRNNDNSLNPTSVYGDQIRIDGPTANPIPQPAATNVNAVLFAGVTVHFKDGTSYTAGTITGTNATGFRIYQLADGRAVLRPVDSTLLDPRMRDFSQWQSLTIIRIGNVGATAMPNQNDPFFVPCFAAGTMILTATGEKPIEMLQVGDLLQTADHGLRPIRWIGRATVSADRIRSEPDLAPISIAASAMAPGLPQRPLRLSPQHRVLLRSSVAARMYGSDEVLCPIKFAVKRAGVEADPQPGDTLYIHLLMDAHEVIFAEGLPCESLYLGPHASQALPDEAQAEIAALFPLLDGQLQRHSTPARPLIRGRRAGNLVARIADRPLIEPGPLVASSSKTAAT